MKTFVLRALLTGLLGLIFLAPSRADEGRRFPNVLVVSVDTLRYDRLSINGYDRPTSPHIDNLLRKGVRFDQARTVEPLTAPTMISVFTSLHPHEHGASRNGLGSRPNLPSWPRALQDRGYKTAAFVGNWTLKDEITGLGEHFGIYREVLNRKRWGLFLGEATAGDLNEQAVEWLDRHQKEDGDWPFLLWVHYVEPHAPYRYRANLAPALGIESRDKRSDRYDTEVAFVDRAIGDLLSDVRMRVPARDLMVVFLSDHGESLGEHGYWGHGRNLYEETLKVPMGLIWEGKLDRLQVATPASVLDLGPTIFGLLGLPVHEASRGWDWSPYLRGDAEMPSQRTTFHQAHKGAVQRRKNPNARRLGLLAVARVTDGAVKEVVTVKTEPAELQLIDLIKDPREGRSSAAGLEPTSEVLAWLNEVREGLEVSDELPPPFLDKESLDQLRALGYID